MKQVLVIDESPHLREYLKTRLEAGGIQVSTAINGLDALSKMRTTGADLLIIQYELSRQSCLTVLEEKRKDPNMADIPVIVTALAVDQKRIVELTKYNVKKVFTKPLKIDSLFETLSSLLDHEFELDETPCIAEAHVNDDIIFVEIAQGLNRDKLDLLRYKIGELVTLYDLKTPKLLLMLSSMKLGFPDAPNTEKLMETITSVPSIKLRNIRVITMDSFVKEFISSRKEYRGIEVASSLKPALDGLLKDLDPGMEYGEKTAQIIGDRVLSAESRGPASEGATLKFAAESSRLPSLEEIRSSGRKLSFAIVDDDMVIQEMLKNTLKSLGNDIVLFGDGQEFLDKGQNRDWDLVFLDLMMPKVDGFKVLESLRFRDIRQPVIVLSALNGRDMVLKAFQLGVKSYLAKPLNPEAVLRKAVEILRPSL